MTTRTHHALGAAVVALGLTSLASAAPSPASGAAPGAEGLIAYVASNPAHEGAFDIYTIARDGTSRVNLTDHPAIDKDPAWSPDGTRLAFVSTRDGSHFDIWVMNADGSGATNLTPLADSTESGQAGTEPAWSPDGTRIAYVYQGDVWVMGADGGGKQNLTHDPEFAAAGISPAWSPDGGTIAYVREGDIWAMGPAGGNKRRLTSTTGPLTTEKFPDWSPDATRLVYERNGQVWTMNRNGTDQTRISPAGGTNPAWSPEGDWVVFPSADYGAPNGPDLFLARPDGTSIKRVPKSNPETDHAPTWQPLPSDAAASSYVTFDVAVTDARITVEGELFNANPGQVVRLVLRRHDGAKFRTVLREDATLTTYGEFRAALDNPDSTTTCKLTARYPGDADSLPTSRTATFDC